MMLYIIIAVVVILLLFIFVTYNSLIKLNNKVKEAFATMDVYLKKRWDLIPNIVEIVKGYAKHENETLEDVIKLRSMNYDDMPTNEKISNNKKLAQGIIRVMALAESYPELKANENFIKLSDELKNVEEDIANSRKYYNATVRDFNNKVEMFPSNLIAKLFNYKTKSMFEISNDERQNIKVEV